MVSGPVIGFAGTVGGLPGSPAITAPPFSMMMPYAHRSILASSKLSSPSLTTLMDL
jgi:hypothetical protein